MALQRAQVRQAGQRILFRLATPAAFVAVAAGIDVGHIKQTDSKGDQNRQHKGE
ncbi:Uncharacterised protein [Klebsiella pneumoniae]|nr:Uncharacterised protein [Klebsiella pneumoniae]